MKVLLCMSCGRLQVGVRMCPDSAFGVSYGYGQLNVGFGHSGNIAFCSKLGALQANSLSESKDNGFGPMSQH